MGEAAVGRIEQVRRRLDEVLPRLATDAGCLVHDSVDHQGLDRNVDGLVAGPNDEMDWLSVDDEMLAYEIDLVTDAGTLLLGRSTYGDFASSWPAVAKDTAADENQRTYAQRVDAMDKVVVSRSGNTADWNNTQLLTDLDLDTITVLQSQPGEDIVVYGSLSLVNALDGLGMIDEYHLLIHPLLLHNGKPLLHGVDSRHLELASADAFHSGVILAKYLSRSAQ